MRKVLPGVALSLVLLASTVGCDRHHRYDDGSFDFELFIAGSWSGSIHDSQCGDGEVRFEFLQTGDHVSGTWFVYFSSRSSDRCWDPNSRDGRLSGPLSGSVSGSGVTFTMERAQGSAGCAFTQPISLTGSWTSTRLTGSYSGVSCGANVTGTVTTGR
jgi:hypothetical protein